MDFMAFEDWCYGKYARNTVIDTVRKVKALSRKVNLDDRESLLSFLRDERRSGSTAKRINEHVKHFNRILEFQGKEKILYLKQSKRSFEVKYYDPVQAKTLIEKTIGPNIEDMRDHTMVLIALNTGLRRSEIAGLRVEDIHDGYLKVNLGKGEKSRDVYLDMNTRQSLNTYLARRNQPGSPYCFTTQRGRITPEYMGKIAARIREHTGIHFSWHKCRHTYAKTLLRNDVDLETIRQMLGHENLGTTQIYAVLDTAEAIQRMRKRNPRMFEDEKRFNSHELWERSNGLEGN